MHPTGRKTCSLLSLLSVFVFLTCVHLRGSGARFRHRSGMMDQAALPALVDAWVAQVLAPAAATRDNAGGSSGSAEIHKHTRPWRS